MPTTLPNPQRFTAVTYFTNDFDTRTRGIDVVLAYAQQVGPGKADLLEFIGETGSISAAGRRMKMSYKRAWQLVETLNKAFDTPLIETSTGGRAGGGAVLTPLGREVLRRYRAMEAEAQTVVQQGVEALRSRLSGSGGA